MYKVSDFKKNSYRVNEVAKILGVTTKTIRNYDDEGKIKTCRTEGNHRIIMKEDLIAFLDNKGLIVDDTTDQKRDILYARVSSHDQKKNGDLDRQVLFLLENIPISFRIHRVKNRWYLQCIFDIRFEEENYCTYAQYGVFGLDYNDGFIEMSETDESGNLIHQYHYDLKYHGTGKKAENEIRQTISEIVKLAEQKGKEL